MRNYFVITGNEFGLEMISTPGEVLTLVDEATALALYDTYVEEYGCAVMYVVTTNGITASANGIKVLKTHTDF